jgi:hypothetical protein
MASCSAQSRLLAATAGMPTAAPAAPAAPVLSKKKKLAKMLTGAPR